eukprot:5376740-Ditylum_brightwellii.AAC.1
MTSANNNPFEEQEVCFKIGGVFGQKLLTHFQLDTFPKEASQKKRKKYYLKGVIGGATQKGGNLYTVNCNYTGLKSMNIASPFLLPGIILANQLRNKSKTAYIEGVVDEFL